MATTIRALREASPARWQAALRRAIAEGVQVRQLAGCGAWIATSGTDLATAYEVGAGGCECHAGQFGDPIFKHRAAYLHARGLLDLDPEPEPPAPAAAPAVYLVTMDGTPYASLATREEAEREAFRLRRWASTATRVDVHAA